MSRLLTRNNLRLLTVKVLEDVVGRSERAGGLHGREHKIEIALRLREFVGPILYFSGLSIVSEVQHSTENRHARRSGILQA